MDHKGKKILIVEDNVGTALVLSNIFQHDGMRIISAGSIEEAEEAIAAGNVDVMVLDRMLPDGDGVQLFHKLKRTPELRHIPVLILSGLDSDEDQAAGLDLGADDYLTKPFSVPELTARVHALLRRAERF